MKSSRGAVLIVGAEVAPLVIVVVGAVFFAGTCTCAFVETGSGCGSTVSTG